MTITNIVNGINNELAGELLTFAELCPFLDSVIDDVNAQLDTAFPSFTDFNSTLLYPSYPDYNFFPEQYIRSVVIRGAAYKFYIMDEEGIPTAQQYGYDYQDALFKMLRDYLEDVPDEYKAEHKASVPLSDVAYKDPWIGSSSL